MAQVSALGLSGVMERVRSIVAKARSTGSLRNITGDVTKSATTGAVAQGSTSITGAIAANGTNVTGSIASPKLTGAVALQE